ncbi:MAG TPA: hypothetical protein VJM12_00260 [Pyrinomonadaceae bacterium]|nr:hypothetical protein [Pyrinomonadaceae bacterium]
MPRVTLKRWKPGLEKITLTKMIQEKAGLSLTSAKECVDRLLAGEEVTLGLPTPQEAARLGEAITALGVDCEVDTADEPAIRDGGLRD